MCQLDLGTTGGASLAADVSQRCIAFVAFVQQQQKAGAV
jgi:hypothetical protein